MESYCRFQRDKNRLVLLLVWALPRGPAAERGACLSYTMRCTRTPGTIWCISGMAECRYTGFFSLDELSAD